jgi:hypothetical protein
MASITLTAANIRPMPGAEVERFDAGGTVTPGQAVYIASDGDVEAADADGSLTALAVGVAVAGPEGKTSFAAGDRVDVVTRGRVTGFSSMTPGKLAFVSPTAGEMTQVYDEVESNDYEYVVGLAKSATDLIVMPHLLSMTDKS